jgi:hypothetical protein
MQTGTQRLNLCTAASMAGVTFWHLQYEGQNHYSWAMKKHVIKNVRGFMK